MNIIINTSTLSASGATQVATSFITECRKFSENSYHVFLSETVAKQISVKDFPDNFSFYTFEGHPLYGAKGFRVRKQLQKLETQILPDVVFSVFGPSWWKPKAPHVQGYAYPYYVYPESPIVDKLTFKEKLKLSLYKKLHLHFLNKDGNCFVSETQDVSERLQKLLPQKKNKFYAVGNTCSSNYYDFLKQPKHENQNILPIKKQGEFRFLSLCTYHLHKNLEILNKVIPRLNEICPHHQIKFVLTLDHENFYTKFTEEAKSSIINLGRIDVKNCPQLYSECDALFLPTLLECFSANYPEAMVMEKPILTSSLSFATTVCGDAAMYTDPLNESEIAEKIIQLYQDSNLRKSLVERGKERLKDFPSAQQRAKAYLEICKIMSRL